MMNSNWISDILKMSYIHFKSMSSSKYPQYKIGLRDEVKDSTS